MKITGARVYTENHIFENKDIFISGDRITEVTCDDEQLDASGLIAIPGLVDIHFHGAMGHDFCDADPDGLTEIARYEAQNGILAICPATMTYSKEILSSICTTAKAFADENKSVSAPIADLVGINMEGPFISKEKSGAQNPKYLSLPDIEMFHNLQGLCGNMIKLVDIAPELEGSMEFIEKLSDSVNISIAHTMCDYDTATAAFRKGAGHVTHLFNAMNGINHRNPGPVIAALENNAEVELIADGIHIHPAMVRFVYNSFSEDKIILISDSMEATGLPDGTYQLGGQKVNVTGNRATLSSDPSTIAGSATNLFNCMKTAVIKMKIPLEKAIKSATENPARSIGIDHDYGSIAPGKYANIILMDDDYSIRYIIQKGIIIRA